MVKISICTSLPAVYEASTMYVVQDSQNSTIANLYISNKQGTAVRAVGTASNISLPLNVNQGGTGTTTVAGIQTLLGLKEAAYRDVGATSSTVASGDHNHTGVYEASGSVASAISSHKTDPSAHSQYASSGHNHDSIYSPSTHNHAGTYDPAGTASAAITNHKNEATPHSQYSLTSHNHDAVYAKIDSPTFTGAPKAPTAAVADNSTTLATTAFVKSVAGGYSVSSHNHDGVYAPIANPTFTGAPKAPTVAAADNTTNIATTAHVKSVVAGYSLTNHNHDSAYSASNHQHDGRYLRIDLGTIDITKTLNSTSHIQTASLKVTGTDGVYPCATINGRVRIGAFGTEGGKIEFDFKAGTEGIWAYDCDGNNNFRIFRWLDSTQNYRCSMWISESTGNITFERDIVSVNEAHFRNNVHFNKIAICEANNPEGGELHVRCRNDNGADRTWVIDSDSSDDFRLWRYQTDNPATNGPQIVTPVVVNRPDGRINTHTPVHMHAGFVSNGGTVNGTVSLNNITLSGSITVGDGTDLGAQYIRRSEHWQYEPRNAIPVVNGGGSGNVAGQINVHYVLWGTNTLTLPANPPIGVYVVITTCMTTTIFRNGQPIMRLNEDLSLPDPPQAGSCLTVTLRYLEAGLGWVLV